MSKHRRKKSSQEPVSAPPRPDWAYRPYLVLGIAVFLFFFPWADAYSLARPTAGLNGILSWFVMVLFFGTGYGIIAGRLDRPRSWLFVPVVAYAVLLCISCFQSPSWYLALAGGMGPNADGYGQFILLLTLGWCVLALRPRPEEVRSLLATLHVQAFLIAAGAIYEFATLSKGVFPYRPQTVFHNPDYFISYALLLLPAAIWLCRSTFRGPGNILWRLRYPFLAITMTASLFLALPTQLQGIVYSSKAASIPVAQAAEPSPTPSATPTATAQPNGVGAFVGSSANTERFTLWGMGWKSFLAHPVLGRGPGSATSIFYEQANDLPGWDYYTVPTTFHNDLIDRLSQTGIPGLAAYLSIWISLYVAFWRSRRSLAPEARELAGMLLAGLAGLFVFDLFSFRISYTAQLAWVFMALAATLIGAVRYPERAPRWQAPLVSSWAVLLIVLTYGFGQLWSAEGLATDGRNATATRRAVSEAMRDYDLAAQLVPQEGLYWRQEASNGLYTAVTLLQQDQSSPQIETTVADSLYAADRSVSLQPHDPLTLLNAGVVDFVLSEPGSDTEKKGLRLMIQAKSAYKWNIVIYTGIVQAFVLKGTTQLTAEQDAALFQGVPDILTHRVATILADAHISRP